MPNILKKLCYTLDDVITFSINVEEMSQRQMRPKRKYLAIMHITMFGENQSQRSSVVDKCILYIYPLLCKLYLLRLETSTAMQEVRQQVADHGECAPKREITMKLSRSTKITEGASRTQTDNR